MDIEITRYIDRLEITSPGALPNSMTIEKMKAGRRTPRNPVILEVMRDYGYVDARGMGVRTKVIPLTCQFTGSEPLFEASEDFLKTVISIGNAPINAPENVPITPEMSLKTTNKTSNAPENVPINPFQGQLLSLIRDNPNITYDELAVQTDRNRKMVQRHLNALKKTGRLSRIGSPKGGHWEIIEP